MEAHALRDSDVMDGKENKSEHDKGEFAITADVDDLNALDPDPEPFLKRGDQIKVVHGDWQDLHAIVHDVNRRKGTVCVESLTLPSGQPILGIQPIIRSVQMMIGDVRRVFQVGNYTRVMVGQHAGVIGMIVDIGKDDLVIHLDKAASTLVVCTRWVETYVPQPGWCPRPPACVAQIEKLRDTWRGVRVYVHTGEKDGKICSGRVLRSDTRGKTAQVQLDGHASGTLCTVSLSDLIAVDTLVCLDGDSPLVKAVISLQVCDSMGRIWTVPDHCLPITGCSCQVVHYSS